jgi:hypothetical protein
MHLVGKRREFYKCVNLFPIQLSNLFRNHDDSFLCLHFSLLLPTILVDGE